MSTTPWQPIYTIERSGQPEVAVFGIISVLTGADQPQQLLALGDVDYGLWSRSLLKPWQLLSHYCEVKDSYPQLEEQHLTLMMSSHGAEELHLKLLSDIMERGPVEDSLLRCPPAYPPDQRARMREKGLPARSLYHNCSGKHFGYLLAMRTLGLKPEHYTDPEGAQFVPLKQILSHLVNRPADSFQCTTDGCQLPNYALSSRELSLLYQKLASPADVSQYAGEALKSNLKCHAHLGRLMRKYPVIIGGADRIDSKLMSGQSSFARDVAVVAKGGADGLMAVGIAPNDKYKEGLGILIKLSAGQDTRHMESISRELFRQLGIAAPDTEPAEKTPQARTDHLVNKFHFQISVKQAV